MNVKLFSLVATCILMFSITACSPATPVEQSAGTKEPTRAPTPTKPPPSPTPTATIDPSTISQYFEHVELLEAVDIPLEKGDKEHYIRSSTFHDMDGDGIAEAIITISPYPENLLHPIVILSGTGPIKNIAEDLFPNGVPEVSNAHQIFFIDFNGDGLEDLLLSEAGLDYDPWVREDTKITMVLNLGGGLWEDVSDKVPEGMEGYRSYPLAAGDVYGDGIVRIIAQWNGVGLFWWNGEGFDQKGFWVNKNLYQAKTLGQSLFMLVKDFDNDGFQDVYFGGNATMPAHQILYGGSNFVTNPLLIDLPETPYGHTLWSEYEKPEVDKARGGDVCQVVAEDYDGDGDLDIVSITQEILTYKPGVFDDTKIPWHQDLFDYGGGLGYSSWFQVLRNDGGREYVDVSGQGQDVGLTYYVSLESVDIDLDGDLDLIGQYWSTPWSCLPRWGTKFFVNEGNLVFTPIDAEEIFPELANLAKENSQEAVCPSNNGHGFLGLGAFFPTEITNDGMQGLFAVAYEFDPNTPRMRVLRVRTEGLLTIP